jgi:hypothetical protein
VSRAECVAFPADFRTDYFPQIFADFPADFRTEYFPQIFARIISRRFSRIFPQIFARNISRRFSRIFPQIFAEGSEPGIVECGMIAQVNSKKPGRTPTQTLKHS